MAWASLDPDGNLAIGCTAAENQLCKQIPGCNIGKDGIWRVKATWPAWVAYRTIWSRQPITELPPLASWAAAQFSLAEQKLRDKWAMDAPDQLRAELIAMEDGGELHLTGVQRGHVNWLLTYRRDILGDPRGNGKTPPLIRALQLLHAQEEGCPALVICPDSAPLAWKRKLAAWAPELRVAVCSSGMSADKRRKLIARVAKGEFDVLIMIWQNFHLHTRLSGYPGKAFVKCDEHGGTMGKTTTQCEVCEKELNGIRFKVVIADEAHRAANPRTKQGRAWWWLSHHTETSWAVTGTLTRDSVEDAWPVLYGLEPHAWPSKSRYLDLWAQQAFAWHGGREVLSLRPDTAEAFHAAFDVYFRRIPAELARPGDPPLSEPEFRYPQMSPAQKRLYRQLVRQLRAELDGDALVPANSAVKFGRLVQLASSSILLQDGEDPLGFTKQEVALAGPSNKADDLLDFLGDETGRWVVACESPDLCELSGRKLTAAGITWTKIIGGMNGDAKDAAATAFCRGDYRVIFVTAAGSEAIDLYADGIFWLRPSPSWVFRDQITGRADRWGNPVPVRQVVSISPGTVDERLWQLGCDKQERFEEIARDRMALQWVLDAGTGDDVDDSASQPV